MKECKSNKHKWFRIWADMYLFQCVICRKTITEVEYAKLLIKGN